MFHFELKGQLSKAQPTNFLDMTFTVSVPHLPVWEAPKKDLVGHQVTMLDVQTKPVQILKRLYTW